MAVLLAKRTGLPPLADDVINHPEPDRGAVILESDVCGHLHETHQATNTDLRGSKWMGAIEKEHREQYTQGS